MSHGAEQLVARRMSLRIIDLLEPVEIDVHHRERAARGIRCSEFVLEARDEEGAIREAREAVEAGLVEERLFRLPPRGDVLDGDDPPSRHTARAADHSRFVTSARSGVGAGEELRALAGGILE